MTWENYFDSDGTISICRWRMNTLVTSQYQPRLSSITKIFSRRISQSDCSIQIKLNYYVILGQTSLKRKMANGSLCLSTSKDNGKSGTA